MAKRDLTNKTIILNEEDLNSTSSSTEDLVNNEQKEAAALSDNISLFQSLRVLQEGEEGDEHITDDIRSKFCLKSSISL